MVVGVDTTTPVAKLRSTELATKESESKGIETSTLAVVGTFPEESIYHAVDKETITPCSTFNIVTSETESTISTVSCNVIKE